MTERYINADAEASSWEEILKKCGSQQVICVGMTEDGYNVYASVVGDTIGNFRVKFVNSK